MPQNPLPHRVGPHFNPLPNDKISNVTKFKAFADEKLSIDDMTTSLIE